MLSCHFQQHLYLLTVHVLCLLTRCVAAISLLGQFLDQFSLLKTLWENMEEEI